MPPHRARATHLPHVFALVLSLGLLPGTRLVAPAPCEAQEAPVSPARYLPPPGYRTKEFTLVRDQGWFHIFYLRENLIPGVPTQLSFGHAISRDLFTWTEQDTILPVVPGTFEATQVWAPSLHKIDGTWFLFYPGMRDEPQNGYRLVQSITCATSPDLYTWTRRSTPLFDNHVWPWAYVDSLSYWGGDCRDPFVWWDAARGEWLMYVSTRPASNPSGMTIGIVGSTDLEHWSDRGMMPLAMPAVSFSDVAESPHVFSRDGSLLLILWTTNAGQSLTYGRSTDAVTGWNSNRRLRNMLGYSTSGWWASEMAQDGDRWYFGAVHDTWVDFWDATWTAVDTFRLSPPDPLQLLSARFEPELAGAGDTVRLEIAAVHAVGRRVALSLTRHDFASSTPLDPSDFGLPDSLVLSGDTTVVTCVLPDSVVGPTFLVDLDLAAGSLASDTLTFFAPVDRGGGEDPLPWTEPPPVRVLRPQAGLVRFVRTAESAPRATADRFVIEVRDVRGRRIWRGEGDGFARALDWRTGGGPGAARVAPGVYFARAFVSGRNAPATFKVVVLE
jgi:hypothetical protein